ncbi:MAG TPA: DNA cytosine methyltransferase [Terriglobales bacterium]
MLSSVSLFSGCGGLDLGLQWAGFQAKACVEMSADACASLRANYLGNHVIHDRIENVSSECLLQVAQVQPGELDLLSGGPPCPPYSKSRFYRKEKPRALDDPTSDTLVNYLRVLRDLRPRAFLLENVAGMAFKVHAPALNLILRTAEELGYNVTYRVVNAADYGVAQMRERLLIVGMRSEYEFQFPEETHGETTEQLTLTGKRPWITAGEVLNDQDTLENADDTGHFAGGQFHSLLEQIPPGDNYLFFTAKRGHPYPQFEWRKRYWSFLLKLSPDLPSWTIQARRSNNMGPFHWRNRILRIEEIKRLQSFPDSFALEGNIESAWRQIGNAVPPKLAHAVGLSIREALLSQEELLVQLAASSRKVGIDGEHREATAIRG